MKAQLFAILVLILSVSETALAEQPIACKEPRRTRCIFRCKTPDCRASCERQFCAFEEPVPFPVYVDLDPAVIDPVPSPEQQSPISLPPPNPGLEQARAKFLERECRAGYTLSCIRLNGVASIGNRYNAGLIGVAETACREGNMGGCEALGKIISREARGGATDGRLNRLLLRNAERLCGDFKDERACAEVPLLQNPDWAKSPANYENMADQCRRNGRLCELVGHLAVQ